MASWKPKNKPEHGITRVGDLKFTWALGNAGKRDRKRPLPPVKPWKSAKRLRREAERVR